MRTPFCVCCLPHFFFLSLALLASLFSHVSVEMPPTHNSAICAAETTAAVVLRVGRDHAQRLAKRFSGEEAGAHAEYASLGVKVLGMQDKGDLMLLALREKTPDALKQFISTFCTDQVVSVLPTLTRIFPTLASIPRHDLARIMPVIRAACGTQDVAACKFRLQGCPRSLEQEVGPELAKLGLSFTPRFADCTHVLSVVRLMGAVKPWRPSSSSATAETATAETVSAATEIATTASLNAGRGVQEGENEDRAVDGNKQALDADGTTLLVSCLAKAAFGPFFAMKQSFEERATPSKVWFVILAWGGVAIKLHSAERGREVERG